MRRLVVVLAIFIASPVSAGPTIDELANLLEGTFDTHANDASLPAAERMVSTYVRLDAPQIGEFVFYQQINQGAELAVYRQRILVLRESDRGVQQQAYLLLHPEQYVDADAESLSSIGNADIRSFMADGCEQLWTKTATGFRGYVDPDECAIVSSRTGKLRRIEAENRLSNASLTMVERGYDADGRKQLFGSPQGTSLLLGRLP